MVVESKGSGLVQQTVKFADEVYVRGSSSSGFGSWQRLVLSSQFGAAIEQGTDLDTLRAPGFYYSPSAATTGSLVHCPITGYNLVMLVLDKSAGNTTQVIFVRGSDIYVRTSVGQSFETWYKFTGTAV